MLSLTKTLKYHITNGWSPVLRCKVIESKLVKLETSLSNILLLK